MTPGTSETTRTPRSRVLGGLDLRGRVLVGRYRLDEVAGCGGTAIVYAGRDILLERRVAVKVFHPEHARSEAQRRRIRREARLLAHLDHPHIVPLLDFGEEPQRLLAAGASPQIGHAGLVSAGDPLVFLVMPLLRAPTLRDLVLAGTLPWPRALGLVRQLLKAVAALHRRGVLHRDLKSQNCLVTRRGDRDHLFLLDLGLARVTAPDLVSSGSGRPSVSPPGTGAVVGTLAYLAPEQARGNSVDERADLYAVGVILFELLTRRVPFTGSDYAVLKGHVEVEPPTPSRVAPPAGIPQEIDGIVRRALAKDPDQRYASADEFTAALAPLLDESSIEKPDGPACRVPEHAGCEDAQAALAAWTRFENTAAHRAADAAMRGDRAWSPLALMLRVLTQE